MSNNKLQELTEHLYAEGLAKGKEQGEQLLAQAGEKAEKILGDAKLQADKIIAEARAKAEEIAAKAQSDVKMASTQILEVTRAEIQNAVLAKSVDKAVSGVLSNEEFAKEVIMAVAKAFNTQQSCELSFVLPESLKNLEAYVCSEVSKAVGTGMEVKLGKNIKGGLNVGPKDGGYYVSLSDETFNSLVREYLRPATRKVLFGE